MMTTERSGTWSVEAPQFGVSERLSIARLQWCLETLDRLGVAVPPSSRIPSALRFLERVHASHRLLLDEEARVLVVEATRAAWEFMLILKARLDSPALSSVFTNEKLELAITGAPTSDEANSIGRDTQFELYVPALFADAGFSIEPGNADASWIFCGERLEIEAKRMKSQKREKLADNLSKAADQILGPRSSGLVDVVRARGLIAVNVDVHFATVEAKDSDEQLIAVFDERLRILDEAGRPLLKRFGLVGVLAAGFVAQWTLPTGTATHPRLTISYPTRWASLVGDDPAEAASAQRFQDAISAVGKNAERRYIQIPKLTVR